MTVMSSLFQIDETRETKTVSGDTTGLLKQAQVTENAGDAAAGVGTAYTVSIDDTFDGSLSGGDTDWIRVDLEAGENYVFQVWGTGGASGGLDDSILRVYDENGQQVAMNDNVASGNEFSLIEYTAPTTGSYYVAVSGKGGESGDYTVQFADDVYTPDQVANYLTYFDWGFPAPLAFDVSVGGTLTVNLTQLTPDGQQLARWALESWSIALGINFVETSSTGADIMFDDNQSGAFAGPSSFNGETGEIIQASVNVGTGWLATYGTTIDSYSFQTYVHEIGHALGLGHAGPYDGSATFGVDNVYLNDSTQMTIMSYFGASTNTFISGDFARVVSPMLADLIGVHNLYGTPQAYTGDTVWGAGSNVGGWMGDVFAILFDGAPTDPDLYNGGPISLTIFDTGGTDTLDISTVSVAQTVDLNPEAVSSIAGLEGNIVIAQGTVIENLISGSGDDDLTGNSANNRIEGGLGNDTVDGGAGTDTAVIDGTLAAATVTESGSTITIQSASGTDVFTNVEFFEFADGTYSAAEVVGSTPPSTTPTTGSDSITGTPGDDQIDGLAGNDTILGGDGNDGLKGSDGDDSLVGGGGDDRLPGAAGDDTVLGGEGNDRLGGGDGNDSMDGGNGNDRGGGGDGMDTITGGAGDDVFSGGAGNDSVNVGDGNDRAAGSYGHDTVIGGDGNDTMGGGRGNDSMEGGDGNDVIGAGDHNDTVLGGAGNDFLGGGDGDDSIEGGTGMDTINSGLGNDRVSGGADADTFVFNALSGGGTTVITDFEDGTDVIRVVGLRNPADPVARLDITNITHEGQQAVTMDYGNHTIIVLGARESDFSEDDFLFV